MRRAVWEFFVQFRVREAEQLCLLKDGTNTLFFLFLFFPIDFNLKYHYYSTSPLQHSLWKLLDQKHEKTPDFYNFHYLAGSWSNRSDLVDVDRTLLPDWSVPSLRIWEKYYFFNFGKGVPTADNDYMEYCKEVCSVPC